MIIYKTNKKGFIEDVESGMIAEKIQEELKFMANKSVSKNEFRSWENSLTQMHVVLASSDLPDDLGIAIEYNLPRSSKRIDFIITGSKDEKRKIIIIELKQWEQCEVVLDRDMIVKTFLGKGYRETVHPSYQSYSYGVFLNDFSEVVYSNENVEVITCGYLHNYDLEKFPDIEDKQYQEYLNKSPLFYKKDRITLRNFISEKINKGDNGLLLQEIDEGQIRPGKSIQEFVKNVIDGEEVFTLIDDQKEVFEKCLSLIRKSKEDNKKRVIIIPGGPGTGKTVIALRILSKCLQYDLNSIYVSKNESLRNAYKKIITDNNQDKKYNKARMDNLFFGSAKFSNLRKNEFDVSIVDEAHRLIDRHQYTPKGKGYDNQIQEIICESKVSIFFIDERQIVTMKDIGTIKEIKQRSIKEGIEEKNIKNLSELKTQFRSSGADEYIKFIDHILYGDEMDNLDFLKNFDLKIFESPKEMYNKLLNKNTNNNARVLAGYCWNWVSKNDSSIDDIVIGDFSMKWNLINDKYFMLNEESINQVGCIHTSQGLEIDYCAVIIGKDLYLENGIVKTNYKKRAKTDMSLKGIGKFSEDLANEISNAIIKNTYKVLLTRSVKGCYIYCEDENLRNYIKSKISS
ncbi:DUF2075 domain-containing protein [Spiroplasma endosymbiont of Diplazon laetatorius]|uniref:DUF2075 domain-containing protein n=1 Tax=Spiroplasma endosymbiont of Diplazon laetatorius TaxID=3066322 RepID=UPI0030CF5BC7